MSLRSAVLTLAAPLLAGVAAASAAGTPPAADPLRAELASIVDLFYGHDFERAAPAAAALEARHPGHPAGPLFEAVVEYQRWTAEGMRDERAWACTTTSRRGCRPPPGPSPAF
jgi:hypothetical protein